MLACAAAHAKADFDSISPGIERARLETRTRDNAPPAAVWVYRAAGWTDAPRACVLIAASGSTGITGASLSEDDVAEHIPYVAEGCIVIAYEVNGAFDANGDPERYVEAMRQFVLAEGGVENARAALRAARAVEPRIDSSRLFVAGHGSGANVALLVAAREPGIRAAVAFAPMSDVIAGIGPIVLEALDQSTPGLKAFLESSQPDALAKDVRCPTMLFHAEDDLAAPIDQTRSLAAAMSAAGNAPTLIEPKQGGHVQAMLDQGLKQAAGWLGQLARRVPATQPTK